MRGKRRDFKVDSGSVGPTIAISQWQHRLPHRLARGGDAQVGNRRLQPRCGADDCLNGGVRGARLSAYPRKYSRDNPFDRPERRL